MARRINFVDRYFAEHIHMPGFPQIVVTRSWLYQWLKQCGWNPSERGFGSMDYATHAPTVTDEPLTDDAIRDHYLNLPDVREIYLRGDHAA